MSRLATGNGWTFAIDQAEARITLPAQVPFKQTALYTGFVRVNTAYLSAPGIHFTNFFDATGLTLASSSGIYQSGNSGIYAGTLSFGIVGGNVNLTNLYNSIDVLGGGALVEVEVLQDGVPAGPGRGRAQHRLGELGVAEPEVGRGARQAVPG